MVIYMSPMRANGGANLYYIFYSNTFAVRNTPCTHPTIYGKKPRLIRHSYINSSLISGAPRITLFRALWRASGGGGSVCRVKSIRMTYVC